MKQTACLFPGQGSQFPGMGRSFYENSQEAKEIFEQADDLLQTSFSKIIFEGPKEVLTETKNSQLAIFITSIAIFQALKKLFPSWQPHITSGLSLGEYSALVAAEKVSFEEALFLVKDRGTFMNEACFQKPGTMAAVLGLSADAVDETIASLQLPNEIWVANYNCPGQIVISGTVTGVEKAVEALKARGAKRAMPLQVFGAFHSGLMQSAAEKLSNSLQRVTFKESPTEIVLNVPGDFVDKTSLIPKYLQEQVTHSVRWQQGIEAMEAKGVALYLEIGCGKVLTGLNKKIGVKGQTLYIESMSDLSSLEKSL